MRVKPKRIAHKLAKYGVSHRFVPGWDSSRIDPYDGRSDFAGIVLHHTAGMDSLSYVVKGNPYAPVRACHFLVQRDGLVRVVSGSGAYHAGKGGPWTFGSGGKSVTVPKDSGNSRLWGIEIESLGTSRKINGSDEGMTVEQVVSTALLCAALLNAGRRGWRSWPVSRVIRHRDWAPRRKVDVLQDVTWWHEVVGIARRHGRKNPRLAESLIRGFVKEHPNGRLR
jgi:N-acetyl-anhydromuramyl-L-alanine amidase AmpD